MLGMKIIYLELIIAIVDTLPKKNNGEIITAGNYCLNSNAFLIFMLL